MVHLDPTVLGRRPPADAGRRPARLSRAEVAQAIKQIEMAAELQISLAVATVDAVAVAVNAFDQWRIATNETKQAITDPPGDLAFALWSTAIQGVGGGILDKVAGMIDRRSLVGASGAVGGAGTLLAGQVAKSLDRRSARREGMVSTTGPPVTSLLLIMSQDIRTRVSWAARSRAWAFRQLYEAGPVSREASATALALAEQDIGPIPEDAEQAAAAAILLRNLLATQVEGMLWGRAFNFGNKYAPRTNLSGTDPADSFTPTIQSDLIRYWWRRFGPAIEADPRLRGELEVNQGLFAPELDGETQIIRRRAWALWRYFVKLRKQLEKLLQHALR